jgi:hypothetical protein
MSLAQTEDKKDLLHMRFTSYHMRKGITVILCTDTDNMTI